MFINILLAWVAFGCNFSRDNRFAHCFIIVADFEKCRVLGKTSPEVRVRLVGICRLLFVLTFVVRMLQAAEEGPVSYHQRRGQAACAVGLYTIHRVGVQGICAAG